MNQAHLIDTAKDLRWDRFVENHPHGQIGHLSPWKKILEKSFRHIKGYCFALTDPKNQSITAALPVYTVKSWLTGNRLVSIPFATLCDPLVTKPNQIEHLLNAAVRHARFEKCKTVEVKSYLSQKIHETNQFTSTSNYAIQQIPISDSLDSIIAKFHPLVRRSIKRSMKSDFKLDIISNTNELIQFHDLYSNTRKRLCLPTQPFCFFKNMLEHLKPSNHLIGFMVLKGRTPVAAALFLKFKNRFSLEYTGWNRAYHKECPNHFLYLEAIKEAKRTGFEIFDLGRTALSNNGLMEFKSRWGATCHYLQQNYFPSNVFKQKVSQEATLQYKVVSKICHLLPRSQFQRFSEFCYRHIG